MGKDFGNNFESKSNFHNVIVDFSLNLKAISIKSQIKKIIAYGTGPSKQGFK